jgi:predicted nucleic acid-binding Zn ribbon protein
MTDRAENYSATNAKKRAKYVPKGELPNTCPVCGGAVPNRQTFCTRTCYTINREAALQTKDASMRMCAKCGTLKIPSEYPPARPGRSGGNQCRDCHAEVSRANRLQKSYGITVAQYDALLAHQGGGCGICGNKRRGKRFAVDHDHKTGAVRGILCSMCNHKLLGGAHDSIERLLSAVRYLQSPPALVALAVSE